MDDPIVEEVRRIRDAQAARLNYDLDAIFREIKDREKEGGLSFVDGVARQSRAEARPYSIGTASAAPLDVPDHGPNNAVEK